MLGVEINSTPNRRRLQLAQKGATCSPICPLKKFPHPKSSSVNTRPNHTFKVKLSIFRCQVAGLKKLSLTVKCGRLVANFHEVVHLVENLSTLVENLTHI